MQYGVILPYGDAKTAVEVASQAEQAGWDGFFMWDPVWGIDPWVSLAAAAAVTSRIRLGTMLTPISRRRPWKLAGETATLDNLSGGRVILATGLGAQVILYSTPAPLQQLYGSHPVGAVLFLRVRPFGKQR